MKLYLVKSGPAALLALMWLHPRLKEIGGVGGVAMQLNLLEEVTSLSQADQEVHQIPSKDSVSEMFLRISRHSLN